MIMKSLKMALASVCMMLGLAFTSCVGDGEETFVVTPGSDIPDAPEAATLVVSSSESSVLSSGGYRLTIPYGSVPRTSSGADGRVAFSISSVEELPADLPDGATMLGSCIKAEPLGFVFDSPVNLSIPVRVNDMSRTHLLRYNDYYDRWDSMPYTNNGTSIETSLIELGYFVVVTYSESQTVGGVYISKHNLDPEFYYYLTLESVDGSASRRISFAPNGTDLLMGGLALGTYRVTISRMMRSGLAEESTRNEYLSGLSVNVNRPLVASANGLAGYTGWTEIDFHESDWNIGRTDIWGTATVTYGTGKFQATLTWVNPTSEDYTDYDLHLFGPDTHVYYNQERSGAFELDRDWTTSAGSAVENIYSVSDAIASGTYQVKVHHYGGITGRRYNCRVIIDGVVVKSVSGAIGVNKQFDDICSFDIP